MTMYASADLGCWSEGGHRGCSGLSGFGSGITHNEKSIRKGCFFILGWVMGCRFLSRSYLARKGKPF